MSPKGEKKMVPVDGNRPGWRLAIAILAAGKGTRLKSKHPKVLHQVGGKPMLAHVVAAAAQVVPPEDIYVIIGHEAERVREAVAGSGVHCILQAEQRGTGHALMVARDRLSEYEDVLVLSGDVPLIGVRTIEKLRDFHSRKRAAMTVLTAEVEHPQGYGRVFRKKNGGDALRAIVEEKALRPEQHKQKEINSGIYGFRTRPLFHYIERLSTNNAHREYYLTDMAEILGKAGELVVATAAEDANEILGSNTRAELAELDAQLRARKCRELMDAGVTIYKPETCMIDADVTAGEDTVIEPFVQLRGRTRIGRDCRIRSFTVIVDSEIGDEVELKPGCVIEQSRVRARAQLGPYTHLRPECDVGEEVHMGNFVEAKKTVIGRGSKANHLTYLGDAIIGEKVNVGAGTITCNYDGRAKHQTIIDDGVFVGSDSTLVAPVRLRKNSYVAAGSTITEEVPEDSLGIARGRQVNKAGWVTQRASAAKK
jgi:bifunctional UDP-N-acetylglucosamine pyrophosphorylase/glucosamine-1-phosphate N-acetyltransferase